MRAPTILSLVALIASIGAIGIAQKQDHGFVAAPGASYDFTQGAPNLGFQRTSGDLLINSITSSNTAVDGSWALCKSGGATCGTIALPASLPNNITVTVPDVSVTIFNDELNAFCSGTVNATANTVVFLSPTGNGGATCAGAGNNTQTAMPFAYSGTVRNLIAKVGAAPSGSNTLITTLFVNGSATALTCTITGPGTTCSDATHQIAVSSGDAWGMQTIDNGTSDTTAQIRVVARHQ